MLRKITGYHRDEEDHWVAELDCFHGQHVRHKPPFVNRPWVETQEGRDSQLGTQLDCLRCDRLELPDGLSPYKRTPEFDAQSVPKGLLKHHTTKAGVWGRINVLEGRLLYVTEYPQPAEHELQAGQTAVVVPEMLHRVAPLGEVRFYVEFLTREAKP